MKPRVVTPTQVTINEAVRKSPSRAEGADCVQSGKSVAVRAQNGGDYSGPRSQSILPTEHNSVSIHKPSFVQSFLFVMKYFKQELFIDPSGLGHMRRCQKIETRPTPKG